MMDEFIPLSQHRAGLERDLTELAGEFCEFIKTHRLEKCFARKVAV